MSETASTENCSQFSSPRQDERLTQTTHACSTPVLENPPSSFAASDEISSIASSRSSVTIDGNNHELTPSLAQSQLEIPQAAAEPSSFSNGLEAPQFAHPPTSRLRKPTRLEIIVSKRLQSIDKVVTEAFSTLEVRSNSSENSVVRTIKKHKPAYKGKDWKMFKPISDDERRIYYRILTSPQDVEEEAQNWCNSFQQDSTEALISVIQFLVDVCGFQQVEVSSLFKNNTTHHPEIIDFMHSAIPEYQCETGKYLLRTNSDWGKQTQNAIYAFIQNILEILHSRDLLCDSVLGHLFGFVAALSMSMIKSMLHTGVVIATKMTTALWQIYVDLGNKIKHYLSVSRMDMTDRLNGWKLDRKSLRKVLLLLDSVFEKHCCVPDPDVSNMKIICIEEMQKWFTMNPSIISSSVYLHKLMRLVIDKSKAVRLAALKTCHVLIESKNFENYLETQLSTFTKVVSGRIYDTSFKVAVAAVEICTTMLNTYPDTVQSQQTSDIIFFVYGKDYGLAKAGGKFMSMYFRSFIEPEKRSDPTEFIKKLIRFVNETKMRRKLPLLIEAILPCCPELIHWSCIIDWLMSDKLDYESEKILVAILSQAVQQTMTGKSKYSRLESRPRPLHPKHVIKISEIFLTKLPLLIKKYSNDTNSLLALLEILLVIDFENISATRYVTNIDALIRLLRPAFVRNSKVEILETISKFLVCLYEENFILKNRYWEKVLTLQQLVWDSIKESTNVLIMGDNLSQDSLYNFEQSLLQATILFADHDIRDVVGSDFIFKTLLGLQENVLKADSMKYIIKCGYWYLIWQMRAIIDNGSIAEPTSILEQHIKELKSMCVLYLDTCFEYMKNSPNIQTQNMAFECICEIHLKFRTENPTKSNPVLQELIPAMAINQSKDLVGFAHGLIFDDRESLKVRRISLGYIMNMSLIEIIDLLELLPIHAHYHSHEDDFKDIFDDYFQSLRGVQSVLLVGIILRTILHCYEKMVLKNDTIPERSNDVDNLRMLAKQFQIFLSKVPEEAKSLIELGIRYAAISPQRYQFLDFIKYFSLLLPSNKKQELLQSLMDCLPTNDETNPRIKSFVWYLKNKKVPGRPAQQEATEGTSGSDSSTMNIEDDTSDVPDNESDEDYNIEDTLTLREN